MAALYMHIFGSNSKYIGSNSKYILYRVGPIVAALYMKDAVQDELKVQRLEIYFTANIFCIGRALLWLHCT